MTAYTGSRTGTVAGVFMGSFFALRNNRRKDDFTNHLTAGLLACTVDSVLRGINSTKKL
jgi:hypothetical protein